MDKQRWVESEEGGGDGWGQGRVGQKRQTAVLEQQENEKMGKNKYKGL